MVKSKLHEPLVDVAPVGAAAEPVYLPHQPQPWLLASLLVGLPGAVASGLALCVLIAFGDGLVAAWTGFGVVGAWLATMGVLWLGAAGEGRKGVRRQGA